MQQGKKDELIKNLQALREESIKSFESLKQFATDEMGIDEFDLDQEALRTPKLHTRWLDLLSKASSEYKKIECLYNKLFLERWKYYSGTASDKYYADYGQMHFKVQKSDLDLYLKADDVLCEAKELVDVCDQKVSFCEKTIKEISSRTFHIRAAIDWRKFASGS
jgi:hypothetical protein